MIGDDIEETIIEVRGDRVKLGFLGPREVPIHREEVYRRLEPCCVGAGYGDRD
jgi:carbon storage regulator